MSVLVYDHAGIQIYCGDCREALVIRNAHVLRADVVITDPPYDARTHAGARTAQRIAGSVDSSERAGRKTISTIEIGFDPLDIAQSLPLLIGASKRWIVAFCTMEMIAEYQRIAGPAWVRAGFWRRPDGAPQFTGDRPATPGDAVAIMHAPGKKRWNGGGHPAYWEYGVERVNRAHPTQKPEALMCEMVHQFSDPDEMILDPFMGSGTTLVAAKRLGRKAIGIERERKYVDIAIQRLSQETLPMTAQADPIQELLV